jgi:hypothetical protein
VIHIGVYERQIGGAGPVPRRKPPSPFRAATFGLSGVMVVFVILFATTTPCGSRVAVTENSVESIGASAPEPYREVRLPYLW